MKCNLNISNKACTHSHHEKGNDSPICCQYEFNKSSPTCNGFFTCCGCDIFNCIDVECTFGVFSCCCLCVVVPGAFCCPYMYCSKCKECEICSPKCQCITFDQHPPQQQMMTHPPQQQMYPQQPPQYVTGIHNNQHAPHY